MNFNPPTLNKTAPMLITNATISLTSNPDPTIPLQSTIIRIHVADTWVAQNLWFPEDPSYWPGGSNYKFLNFTAPGMWFLGALTGGFGKLSGTIDVTDYYIDVLVKVKTFHAAKIEALAPEKLTPNEVTSVPILIQNLGNYNDTFSFRVISETGYPLENTDNGTVTLQPGQQGLAYVGVAVPANILDTGTLHSLMLEVFSADQPNTTIASQRIFLETQGLYISEENGVIGFGIGLLLIIALVLIFIWRRKYSEKTGKKPEKPWKIPEERHHLAELKRTDRNTYEQERIMMEDEYKTALLSYNDYRKSLRKKPKTKKPKKKPKEKPQKKVPALFKRPIKKPKEQTVKPVVPTQETLKEKAIARIKKEQDKQLRTLK